MAKALTIAYIPCGSEDDARKICRMLITNGLSCCTKFFKSKSMYVWEGEMQDTHEWVILAKTLPERFEELKTSVEKVHPYGIPCILAIPVADVNDAYYNWAKEQLKPKK